MEGGACLSYFAVLESVVEIDAKTDSEARCKAEGLKSSLNLLFGTKTIEVNITDLTEFYVDDGGAYE